MLASVLSIRYSSLNEGKAMAINTNAGVIVQISSISVPWLVYLWAIPTLVALY